MVKTLRLLHFNDVYNIEPANQNLAGGAARFASLVGPGFKCFAE